MKTAFLATVCVAICATQALAIDLQLRSSLSQTLEINDNRNLNIHPIGVTFAPVSSLTFDVLARTPTLRFEATGNLDYRNYLGPGAVSDHDALDKAARAKLTKTTKLTTYDIGISWSQRDAGQVQLQDVGFSTVTGELITYALEGGFKHQFGPRDSFQFTTRGSSVTFTAQPKSNYQDITSSATWIHKAYQTLDVFGLVNYYFQDRTSSALTMWQATGGIDARLSPRLSLRGSAGAVVLESNGAPITTASGSPFISGSGTAVSWIADASLVYKLTRTTQLTVVAARSVAPDGLGDVQQRETISASLTEEINSRSSLTFNSVVSRIGAGANGGSSDNLSASTTYAYRLTPELYTNVSYRFNMRTGSTGFAHSNSVLFSVRRDVVVLP